MEFLKTYIFQNILSLPFYRGTTSLHAIYTTIRLQSAISHYMEESFTVSDFSVYGRVAISQRISTAAL